MTLEAYRFKIIRPLALDGATVSSVELKSEEYPPILDENATGKFPLIEELLHKNNIFIPEQWSVGDMLAFLIAGYVRILDKNDTETEVDGSINALYLIPPNDGNLLKDDAPSFEVWKNLSSYNGTIMIPNNSKNSLAGLLGTGIKHRVQTEGRLAIAVAHLTQFDFIQEDAEGKKAFTSPGFELMKDVLNIPAQTPEPVLA